MEGNIVYKSTSEFLKFISDKAKAKNKTKNNKNHNKINKNKIQESNVIVNPNSLNYQ